jgi:hypothetical protein
MTQRFLSISTVAITSLALTFGAALPASASASDAQTGAPPGTAEAIVEAGEFLSAFGVDKSTQNQLFDKFLAGEAWDSFSSASVAVYENKSIVDGHYQTVAHYPDGSVAVSRVEIPVSTKTDFGVRSSPNGCTVGSGGARTNCNVDMWVGLIAMAFKANYNVSTNRVTSVWGSSWSIGGSCSSSQQYLGTPNRNTGNLTVSAQMCGIPYSTSFNLAVTVSGGVATESWW